MNERDERYTIIEMKKKNKIKNKEKKTTEKTVEEKVIIK